MPDRSRVMYASLQILCFARTARPQINHIACGFIPFPPILNLAEQVQASSVRENGADIVQYVGREIES